MRRQRVTTWVNTVRDHVIAALKEIDAQDVSRAKQFLTRAANNFQRSQTYRQPNDASNARWSFMKNDTAAALLAHFKRKALRSPAPRCH
jgi:hypothetical protein